MPQVASTGHRLPVFSLSLDAPPQPDEQLAQFVRLRSRGRDARPAGTVDELIKQSQARQRNAAPIRGRAPIRIVDEGKEVEHDQAGAGAGSARRHKKRGSGSQRTQEEAAPVHLHLMYRDQGEDVPRSGEEDGERGHAGA